MGLRQQGSHDGVYTDTSIHADEDLHTVPVENFLNAQCEPMFVQSPCISG